MITSIQSPCSLTFVTFRMKLAPKTSQNISLAYVMNIYAIFGDPGMPCKLKSYKKELNQLYSRQVGCAVNLNVASHVKMN